MQHDDFMKKCIIAMAIFLLAFTITILIIFVLFQEEPTALVAAVFAACVGEGSILGWLKKTKISSSTPSEGENENEEEIEEDTDELEAYFEEDE